MLRADRELLAELGRLNSDVVPLAMRIMDESVTPTEQHVFAERLIAMARRLQSRASGAGFVIEGKVVARPDGDENTVQRRGP